ncbi:carboxymuconolactone decarboxylase family protein [Pseudorhodoferax sp.]|uniref:carboxymuconolactone decarboxylase family protein n=1 Tax=Pseudorhodoferax sp. TaxID=1993553 RepID=UPI002DD64328|nr:carboxymuconolactone decarboxylase family protein [Pseudorhodoferax sp.]
MTQRLQLADAAPNAPKGLYAASAYLTQCSLPITLVDLVYLRVSQINGCAYCIDKHSRDLLQHGMALDKLLLVSVWAESGALFDARERAALAWAESLTQVAQTQVPDADFAAVSAVFTPREVADLTMAAAIMNAWNRIGVSMRMTPAAAAQASA